jgi:Na+/H+ antiporter NhaC
MKKFRTLALIPALMLLLSVYAFAIEATPEEYADKFGFVTLVPAIIALVLAYFTKNLIFSLLMGIFAGGYLLSIDGINILGSIGSSFNLTSSEIIQQLTLGRNAGIILQCLMITGLVALITRNGGASALAKKVSGM